MGHLLVRLADLGEDQHSRQLGGEERYADDDEHTEPAGRELGPRPRYDERNGEREHDEDCRDDQQSCLVPGQCQQHARDATTVSCGET